jgi:cytoskeletal protein CcmA (bactofilin family)
MWDKKDAKDSRPGEFTGGTGYASQSYPASSKLVNIGQTIFIKGELTGTEDLTIDGRVEGKIELKDHNLTIGPNGKIKADLYAKNIVITGEVLGNAFASEKVEVTNSGVLKGDIVSPRIVIADGAQFKGSVDMDRGGAATRDSRSRSDQVKPLAPVKDDVPAYSNKMMQPQAQAGQADKH